MPEKALSITKRQYDQLASLFVQKAQVESLVSAKCDTILAGQSEEIDRATVLGVRPGKNGVCELVIEVPDAKPVEKPTKPLKAPRVRG